MSSSLSTTNKPDADDYELSPLFKKMEVEKFTSLEDFRIRLIQILPDNQFWNLVKERLNEPLSSTRYWSIPLKERNNREYWLKSNLIEELFLQLAQTKQIVVNSDGKHVTIWKYYNQALELLKIIAVAKPTPIFSINGLDLDTRLLAELRTIDNLPYVLKEAVARLYENIDARLCHLSVLKILKVRLH